MTAKNKDDFLFHLHNELHRIGIEDNEDIFADFEEHFRASAEQGYTEEETCAKLGDVKEIARSYIDIDSSKINSIVANAIEDSRPHVSLTKPGRSTPVSIAKPAEAPAADIAVEEAPKTEIITDQPEALREITPEHIAAEQPAPTPSAAPVNTAVTTGSTSTHAVLPVIPFPAENNTQTDSQRVITPQHIAAEQPAPSSIPMPAGGDGSGIKTAPKSDPAPVPEPPQPVQEQKSGTTEHNAGHKAELPHVDNDDGKGGFKWTDIKGREPNVNVPKLVGQLCIDLFVLSWALPLLATLIWHFLTVVVFGIVSFSFSQLGGGAPFHALSRIFLCGGLISLSVVLCLLWVQMVKGFIHIIKAAVIGHVKAIYDL